MTTSNMVYIQPKPVCKDCGKFYHTAGVEPHLRICPKCRLNRRVLLEKALAKR